MSEMCDPTTLLEWPSNGSMIVCHQPNGSDQSVFNETISGDPIQNISVAPIDLGNLRMVNMTQLVSYILLFPLAAVGNLMVFLALFRNRHRKSRVNMMLLHLSVADMIVTFIFLPTEITWNVNIEWVFGNVACKFYKYISAFGFYISSMVLVCVSLDRYFAVLHPLKVNDAQRRGKIMLFFAWLISAVISLPQSIIFSVQTHPLDHSFQQCVTFGFLNNNEEMIYTIFVISFLYFIPLTIIIFAYTKIIIEITKKSRENKGDQTQISSNPQRPLRLRRSNATTIEKARSRTLSMTFIIVMAFVWCWTPYSICTLWNYIDQDSFRKLNRHLQDIFLIIAVSNSVVNPFIYGRYSLNRQKRGYCSKAGSSFMKLCKCLFPFARNASCRKSKFSTGITKSNLTLYTPSTRPAAFKLNPANIKKISEREIVLNSDPSAISILDCQPEMISMVPLKGSRRLFHSAAEFSTSEKFVIAPSSSLRDFCDDANHGSDASSGYCSTHLHCQSFQDVSFPSPERLYTVWENHHSC